MYLHVGGKCTCICVYMCISVFMHLNMCTHDHPCVCMYVCVRGCVSAYICMNMFLNPCVSAHCMCLCAHIYVHMYVCTHTSVYMYLCVHLCGCLYTISVNVNTCERTYVSVGVHVLHVYMFVCCDEVLSQCLWRYIGLCVPVHLSLCGPLGRYVLCVCYVCLWKHR